MPQDKITDIETKKQRPIGTLSIDVKTIYDRLILSSVGDIVKYDDMSAMIGRDIRSVRAQWILGSARRRALVQARMLFAAVPKVGIQRLNDSQIVDTGDDALKRIHRLSLRTGRKMTAIQNFEALPAAKKLQHNTQVSALAMLAHMTKDGQMKKLEAAVSKAQVALPLQKTLEAFKE